MTRVKNRQMAPINGWQFFQPQTGWDLQKNSPQAAWSFDMAVDAIINHRKANARFGLSTDKNTVQEELDQTNALRMQAIPGGDNYIIVDPGAAPPKSEPRTLSQKLHAVAVGANTIVLWLNSGAEAVAQDLANKRAETCSKCALNDSGDWTRHFTMPAQNAIRYAVSQRKEWNLSTPFDAKLNICSACLCPIPLKVHMPFKIIKDNIPKESFDALAPDCWIRAESK